MRDKSTLMKTLLISLLSLFSFYTFAQTFDGGGAHSIMLCKDSSVWTVGLNITGQLGGGTASIEFIPIETGLTDVISVQAGLFHTLALKSDGTVWSWGNNAEGQLGNSTTTESYVPIQVPGLSDIVKIVVGDHHNIAIESDSSAWIWGSNQSDQIDSTGIDKLFPISAGSNIVDIIAGGRYTARLFQDSIIEIQGVMTKLLILSDIVSLGSGVNHLFMIKSDSTILAWGDNNRGQLGDGTTVSQDSNIAVQVLGLSNVISIKGGQRHSIALKDDGTVWTWGWNGKGQLGNNTLIDELTPIQVPGLDSVIEISAGVLHCMARRADSTIWAWGQNAQGQLGNDTSLNTTIPVQMMLSCIPFQCPAPQVYSSDVSICSGDSTMIFGAYEQIDNTYYDSLSTSEGCDSVIQIQLMVDPLPIVSFTGLDSLYCLNSDIDTLIGLPEGGVFSGTGVVGGLFIPISGVGTFTITYTYVDSNGCEDSQSKETTLTICTSIDEIEFSDFKMYPNPCSGVVNIESKQDIEILNVLGQVIYNHKPGNIRVNLNQGVYFVKSGAIKKLVVKY